MRQSPIISTDVLEVLKGSDAEALQMAYCLQEIMMHLSYEGKASHGKNVRKSKEVLSFFKKHLGRHLAEEEKIVFPFLKKHIPRLEPLIEVLSREHEDFRKNLRRFQFWLGKVSQGKTPLQRHRIIERLQGVGVYLICLLERHAQQEDGILYRMARQRLRPKEKKELFEKLVYRRRGGRNREKAYNRTTKKDG